MALGSVQVGADRPTAFAGFVDRRHQDLVIPDAVQEIEGRAMGADVEEARCLPFTPAELAARPSRATLEPVP